MPSSAASGSQALRELVAREPGEPRHQCLAGVAVGRRSGACTRSTSSPQLLGPHAASPERTRPTKLRSSSRASRPSAGARRLRRELQRSSRERRSAQSRCRATKRSTAGRPDARRHHDFDPTAREDPHRHATRAPADAHVPGRADLAVGPQRHLQWLRVRSSRDRAATRHFASAYSSLRPVVTGILAARTPGSRPPDDARV